MKNCIEYNVELDSLLLFSSLNDSSNENKIEFHTTESSLEVTILEGDTTTTTTVGVSDGIAQVILDNDSLRRVSTIYVNANSTTPIQIVTLEEIPQSKDILISLIDGVFYCKEAIKNAQSSGISFTTDQTLSLSNDGILSVNTTNSVEKDNALPITSEAVYSAIGSFIEYKQEIISINNQTQFIMKSEVSALRVKHILIFINGLYCNEGIDYTIDGLTITLTKALKEGQQLIYVVYGFE